MSGRPVVFGEVLFDIFPGNQRVLGGAPFNVSWHLHGFGVDPLFVSSVGDDDNGRDIRARMRDWGMDTSGIQNDADHPTGAVNIEMDGKAHTFSILADQAYDHVDLEKALAATGSQSPGLLYHGSLALREQESRDTFRALRDALDAPVFVDINLRDPWWTPEVVLDALQHARWAKVNDDELAALWDDDAATFRARHDLDLLIVTMGGDGAFAVTADETVTTEPARVETLVDTVGAGDSFSAVTILGLLQGWPLPVILQRANAFAARICGQRGATAPDKDLYASTREHWQATP